LRPNGLLVLVDFAPHALEFLREEHAHRRLGFADADVEDWCRAAGLEPAVPRHLPGDPLTVVIWTARRANGTSRGILSRPANRPRRWPEQEAAEMNTESSGAVCSAPIRSVISMLVRAHLVRVLPPKTRRWKSGYGPRSSGLNRSAPASSR